MKVERFADLLGMLFVLSFTACATGGGSEAQLDTSKQLVEFKSASIGGEVQVSTPSGLVTVDLKTGLVGGDALGSELVKLSVTGDVNLLVEGVEQSVSIESHGARSPASWYQCVEIHAILRAMGLGLKVDALPPGLNDLCGKPYLSLLPIAIVTTLEPVPPDPIGAP